MNCDSPSGVRLVSVVVMVTAVPDRSGRVATCTDTGRNWSSLLPPWLITLTASEVGVRVPAGTARHPRGLGRRVRRPHHEVTPGHRPRHRRGQARAGRSTGPAAGAGRQTAMAPSASSRAASPARVVRQSDVLVVQQVLHDVGGVQRRPPDLHGAGRRHDLAQPDDVDGQHPVDLLAGAGRPHPRRQVGAVTGNCGVTPEVPPVDARLQPAPVPLEVAGHDHLARGEAQAARGAEVAEVDRAVGGRRPSPPPGRRPTRRASRRCCRPAPGRSGVPGGWWPSRPTPRPP